MRALGGLAVFWVVWANLCAVPALASDERAKPAIVFTSVLKQIELFDQLSYPGRVVSKVNTTVLSEADGVVSRIFAPLGKSVRRRERVLEITHTDPVYQYAPVMMTSPVSGVVSSVQVTEGTQVAKGQPLATITDPAQIRLIVEVPSPDLPYVHPGTLGEFRLDPQSAPLAARITGVSPFVDPSTGTASCELELAGKDASQLRPGQVGQIAFKAGAHQGIQIPDYAIVYKGGKTFVRLLDGGKAKQVAVTLGHKQRGQVELLSGAAEKAVLIERASRFVADGEAVTVEGDQAK
jgi:multidrug efflux pump subunit AcrA (membrane-fusion protein)